MWIARTVAQCRHLPDEDVKWNSVFRRYRRWVTTGVFDAMLETLGELAGRDTSADMIDSTVVRAHHCAVGIKRGLSKPRRSEEHTSELQSLMRISYAVFCLKKNKNKTNTKKEDKECTAKN